MGNRRGLRTPCLELQALAQGNVSFGQIWAPESHRRLLTDRRSMIGGASTRLFLLLFGRLLLPVPEWRRRRFQASSPTKTGVLLPCTHQADRGADHAFSCAPLIIGAPI